MPTTDAPLSPPHPAETRSSHAPAARADSPAPSARDPRRWEGVVRAYGKADVERLRGSVRIEHTLARLGAERLWELLRSRPYVSALGALTGGQAVQMVKAGLEAIYLSGWQVAADANGAGQTYPDQSLYPSDSVPAVVRRLNAALQRVDQIEHSEGRDGPHWFAPIVADAEAGFGGPLNAFELMKAMIEAGAAGVHFEDQVAAEKKCGHLGGKVLVPTSTFVRTLTAARLAADVMGVPTLLVARTDAESATLLMSDVDPVRRALRRPLAPNARGLLRLPGRPRGGHRPRHRLRALRRPRLVRDAHPRPRGGAALRRGHPRAATRASSSPTTARPPSTGASTSTTRPSPASSASSAPWATSSSSSPSPGSTR